VLGDGGRGISGNPGREDDFLGLQRDLGAVLAGQSGLNRNGLRLSRNPSIKRKAAAKAGPAPAADPRHRNPRKFLRSATRRRRRGLRRRTPLLAGALARRTGSLSAEAGRRGAARGRRRQEGGRRTGGKPRRVRGEKGRGIYWAWLPLFRGKRGAARRRSQDLGLGGWWFFLPGGSVKTLFGFGFVKPIDGTSQKPG